MKKHAAHRATPAESKNAFFRFLVSRTRCPSQLAAQAEAYATKTILPPNSDHVAPDRSTLIALARDAAMQHSLDLALVCAIVEQESAWDPHAIRYEPAFRQRYVAPLGLPPTEEVGAQFPGD
jgi:soluble lytic murein transglycosylase-like protein